MQSAAPSPLATKIDRSALTFRPAVRLHRWIIALVVAAVVWVAIAVGGRDIAERNSDLPAWPELANDAKNIYRSDAATGWRTLFADHTPIRRIAKLGLVAWNGQIDARVLELVSLILHATSFGLLLLVLSRGLRLTTVALVGATLLALLATSGADALAPLTAFTGTSLLVLLSLAHLGLMTRARTFGAAWWAGLAAGLLNIATATAGIGSAIALIGWSLSHRHRPNGRACESRPLLLANIALLVVGIAVGLLRIDGHASNSSILSAWIALAEWPLGHWSGAILVWAPAVWCLVTSRRANRACPPRSVVSLLAGWAITELILLGLTQARPADAPLMLIVAIVVNASCFTATMADTERGRTVRFVLLAGWSILVGAALLRTPPRIPLGLEESAANIAVFRKALMSRDVTTLDRLPGSADDRRAAAALIEDPSIAPILPVSVRPPLPLTIDRSAPSGFQLDAVPPLAERDALPAYGTWTPTAPMRTGELASEPITTRFPLVQIRVAGLLREPGSSLRLRLDSGAEIAPLTSTISATDRWRRVNFDAPRERFRVVARVTNSSQWLAVAAPLEMGTLTRVAAKLPRYWTVAFALGLSAAAGASIALGCRSMRRMRSESAAATASDSTEKTNPRLAHARSYAVKNAPRLPGVRGGGSADPSQTGHVRRLGAIPWRVVPWVALFGYFVFFAAHIDGTAGPNDSGGYLNSAKLMVEGHLTAAPRSIFGANRDLDIAAYLPMTFHANGDRMVPEYPVGWPLEVALFGKLLGLARGVPALIMLQLVLGIVFTQRLARAFGLPSGWAWLAAGVVGLNPVYLFEGLQPVSDVPALVWVTAAVYWAWLSREQPRYAILAGLATALAVMIRPSNLLVVPPIMLCLAGRWRQSIAWALAGVPGAAWLAWYQHTLYGSWHTTGYGDVHTSFATEFIWPTLQSYATWLPELLTPLVVLGFAAPFLRSIPGRVRLVLTVWVALFGAFYATYWCTWDNWYNMRFVLPAFPPAIILALFVVKRIAERSGLALFTAGPTLRTTAPTAALVIATLGFVGVRTADREIVYWMHANHKPREVSLWVRDHLPANAVVFAKHITGSLFYYTDLTFVRLDYEPAQTSTAVYERIEAAGRPIYAMTCHWETPGYTWGHGRGTGYPGLPGNWERIAALGEDDFLVWRWHPPAKRSKN